MTHSRFMWNLQFDHFVLHTFRQCHGQWNTRQTCAGAYRFVGRAWILK
jgi:hypothetical protein